jgi:hypothetical protein
MPALSEDALPSITPKCIHHIVLPVTKHQEVRQLGALQWQNFQ